MKKQHKRYSVEYISGATGYGWEQETDNLKEAKEMVKAVYNYTAEMWVWDNVMRDHVYLKRVLTHNPEINTIGI